MRREILLVFVGLFRGQDALVHHHVLRAVELLVHVLEGIHCQNDRPYVCIDIILLVASGQVLHQRRMVEFINVNHVRESAIGCVRPVHRQVDWRLELLGKLGYFASGSLFISQLEDDLVAVQFDNIALDIEARLPY